MALMSCLRLAGVVASRALLVACILVVSSGCAHVVDVRARLLAAAREQDPEFPDGRDVQLTRFAYIGSVDTPDGPVYVVQRLAVLTGMLAPRGIRKLDFYDHRYDLLGSSGGVEDATRSE